MKVTKLIREYVEESVAKKFAPLYEANEKNLPEENTVETIMDKVSEDMAHKVGDAFRLALAPYYDAEDFAKLLAYEDDRKLISKPYSWRVKSNYEKRYTETKDRLDAEKAKAVKDILIELELGGTKEDLDRLIGAVNPVIEEE